MNTTKKTILIADDDSDYMFIMKSNIEKIAKLENITFEVITADNQKEAEEILKNTEPDLAIFDLMMENEDSGFILSYQSKKKYPNIKIIIATAVAAETGIRFSIDTEAERNWIKADLYLEKGIRFDQLHREVVKLLNL